MLYVAVTWVCFDFLEFFSFVKMVTMVEKDLSEILSFLTQTADMPKLLVEEKK